MLAFDKFTEFFRDFFVTHLFLQPEYFYLSHFPASEAAKNHGNKPVCVLY